MRRILWAAAFFAAAAWAQPYPAKPLRIVVPLVPGGNQDIVARAVAEELSKGLGQQVLVENRPGQSAIIGTQYVKAAPADGYTLLSVSNTFARVPSLMKSAGYDPFADFAAISVVCRIPQLLVVNAASPMRTLQDLIAAAKAKPGEISWGTSGNGSTGHVAGEMFMRMTGTKLLHVQYKGNAQALVDLMGGQIAMMFDQVSTSAGQVKAGKLRALGVTALTRSPLLPEVPTLHEQGLANFEDVTWNGLVAPTGTPREVLARLHAELAKIMARPDFTAKYMERGIEMVASRTPEEFSAYVKSEAAAFARLVLEAGIKVD